MKSSTYKINRWVMMAFALFGIALFPLPLVPLIGTLALPIGFFMWVAFIIWMLTDSGEYFFSRWCEVPYDQWKKELEEKMKRAEEYEAKMRDEHVDINTSRALPTKRE